MSEYAGSLTDERTPQEPTEPPQTSGRGRKGRDPAAENEARLARIESGVREAERKEPLLRRILAELAASPGTPSDLATRVDAAVESVSKKLSIFLGEGLVEVRGVHGDGRLRQYLLTDAGEQLTLRLTAEGEQQLSKLRAYGAPVEIPPVPAREEAITFLRAGLADAVMLRRKTNRLAEAIDRMEIVVEQAHIAEADELWVEALIELVTTLRQDHRTHEAKDLLDTLEQISLGGRDGVSPEVRLPAFAHYAYAIGRLHDERGESLAQGAEHLTAASSEYARLADAQKVGSRAMWRERHGWSIIAHASNLHSRSKFEDALAFAHRAQLVFEELNDDYGRSRSLFVAGFCLRLLGDFDGALQRLELAHQLAEDGGYERFRVDSLLQLGEARRCQGELKLAGELLDRAVASAEGMGLAVIHAFARSARGAVFHQIGDFDSASSYLATAHDLFTRCRSREGFALNGRRRATVARHMEMAGAAAAATTRELIDFARGQYVELDSPAGMVACDVELGRLQLMRENDVSDVKRSLVDLLNDDPERERLLERDPWVPRVLDAFALEVDPSGPFRERTHRLRTSEERWLAHRIGRDESRVEEALCELEERQPDEMGGESRHISAGAGWS